MTVDKYKNSSGSSICPNLEPYIPKVYKDCNHLSVLDTSAGGEGATKDPSSCAMRESIRQRKLERVYQREAVET